MLNGDYCSNFLRHILIYAYSFPHLPGLVIGTLVIIINATISEDSCLRIDVIS